MFGLAVATTSDAAVAASLGAEAFPSVALFDRGNAARWFHFQNVPKKIFIFFSMTLRWYESPLMQGGEDEAAEVREWVREK